jgi:hypothetical protein
VAAARVCVLSMSELEMVDAAVGMGCELTIISLTIMRLSWMSCKRMSQKHARKHIK